MCTSCSMDVCHRPSLLLGRKNVEACWCWSVRGLMWESDSMWSSYENALHSPCAALVFSWKGSISFIINAIRFRKVRFFFFLNAVFLQGCCLHLEGVVSVESLRFPSWWGRQKGQLSVGRRLDGGHLCLTSLWDTCELLFAGRHLKCWGVVLYLWSMNCDIV